MARVKFWTGWRAAVPSSFGNLRPLGSVYPEVGNPKGAREVVIEAMEALKLDARGKLLVRIRTYRRGNTAKLP